MVPATLIGRRAILVGESNPYGGDPRFALYPAPAGCAGHRLCSVILGLTEHDYLRRFERLNLCAERWSSREACAHALEIRERARGGRVPALILLGRKVAAAFGHAHLPPFSRFFLYEAVVQQEAPARTPVILLPHPSGRCREWSAPGAIGRARALLAEVLA